MSKEFVLIFNCGSSSVKFALINPVTAENILSGLVQRIGAKDANIKWRFQDEKSKTRELGNIDYQNALESILALIETPYNLTNKIFAVGHRVVHGGEKFTQSVLITPEVLANIKACARLAPLHNPANAAGIVAAQKAFPNLPQVAAFDTAFHQTMARHAYIYPIPYKFYTEHAVRRYGFHGISHQFVSRKAAVLLDIPLADSAFICAHLGNGCSVTAILNGKSIDTSMGLTPLEGLVMGTRSGDVDPSLHSFLADNLGLDVHKVTNILNKESGMLGISEQSSDLRDIEDGIAAGDERCTLAGEIFCYRLAKYIAALMVSLPRIDALLFTGGIGENSDYVRAKTLTWLKSFDFEIDEELNRKTVRGPSGIITKASSAKKAVVIPTNEELLIAQDTATLAGVKLNPIESIHEWAPSNNRTKQNYITPAIFQENLFSRAKTKLKRIALPEGEEIRTLKAALSVAAQGMAQPILFGDPLKIKNLAQQHNLVLPLTIEIIDAAKIAAQYIDLLVELRKHKGMTKELAATQIKNNVMLATLMLERGEVDGLVSGAIHTTADTIRPALQIIKTRPDAKLVSSLFFMCLPDQVLTFSDCGVNPNPSAAELADIALQTAITVKAVGIEPRIAFLSYSTGNSSAGPDVEKVALATRLAQEKRPDLLIDGPLQYDAAIIPEVAILKAPSSRLAGTANVLIFPDLDSGNIAYKAVQRSANCLAIGPVLQGLRKPVNDLSRGCLVDDIILAIALTAVQAI